LRVLLLLARSYLLPALTLQLPVGVSRIPEGSPTGGTNTSATQDKYRKHTHSEREPL
jgi:hypothetical protein